MTRWDWDKWIEPEPDDPDPEVGMMEWMVWWFVIIVVCFASLFLAVVAVVWIIRSIW